MRARIRPRLGQHFLRSEDFCRKIAATLPLYPDDLLIEIGPGRGDVTRLLVPRVGHLVAIELDSALAASLRETYRNEPRVDIIEGDVLKTNLEAICRVHGKGACVVFGNLPYYITSPVVRHLFAARACIRHITILVQREVAERITAHPGSRAYGYLSVLAQCYSRPRIVLEVPPGAFSPPPKVRSALVNFEMTPKFPAWDDTTHAAFLRFVAQCFAQKRKSLPNSLAAFAARPEVERALQAMNLDRRIRAEHIGIEQLAALFEFVKTGTRKATGRE